MLINTGNPEVTLDTNILEIEVPAYMEKGISTGIEHVDLLCAGDGMIPTTVLLLTGVPGSGKTTLSLQLADGITSKGNVCIYNSCEESLVQLRKTTRRLSLRHGFIPSYFQDLKELQLHAEAAQVKFPDKQLFLIIDSLQTVEWSDPDKKTGRPYAPETMRVRIAWEMANWAKRTKSIVILIGQVNKDGTFSGRQEIKHAIDAHMHLDYNRDRYSENYRERQAEMEKNRFGNAGISYPFELTTKGVVFHYSSATIKK